MTARLPDRSPVAAPDAATSAAARWGGRVLTGISILFLTFDAVAKIAGVKQAVDGSVQLGYPANTVVPIGFVLLACVILYAIPRTGPLGAVLLTGYLGGAIATNVRVGSPLFSHVLFPTYVAAILWSGLYLRDTRVRALVRSAR